MFKLKVNEFTEMLNNGEIKLHGDNDVIYNGKTYTFTTNKAKYETTFKLKLTSTVINYFKGTK